MRSQRHSRNASQCARPMVKAGNRMWNEITNANCTRERNSGDSSRSSTWRDSAARGERRRAHCAPAVVTFAKTAALHDHQLLQERLQPRAFHAARTEENTSE